MCVRLEGETARGRPLSRLQDAAAVCRRKERDATNENERLCAVPISSELLRWALKVCGPEQR